MPKKFNQEEVNKKDIIAGFEILNPIEPYIDSHTLRKYKCPICTKIFLIIPKCAWKQQKCSECSHKIGGLKNWKGTKDISGNYYRQLKHGAKRRNHQFNITIEYLQDLLEKQNFKCALTKLPIVCSRSFEKRLKTYSEQTASVDRINNNIGYIEGNVQWVHKDINWMKQDYSNLDFINYCILVAKNYTLGMT